MNLYKSLALILFSVLSSLSSLAALKIPKLSSSVIDQANFLPKDQELKLASVLNKLVSQGGSQVQVLTLENLGGIEIEQASIQITDQWKLGSKDADNGVLLLIAKAERRIRIEVGQGLEGQLTDAYSKRIIDEIMLPLFKAGSPESGITLGLLNIIKYTDPNFSVENAFENSGFQSKTLNTEANNPISTLLKIILLIFFIFLGARNPALFFLLMSGSGRRGRRGGGWSGGGGGFSGGGASGGW